MKPPIKSQSDMTGTIAESPRSFALSTMPTMALRKLHAMRDLAKLPFTVEPSCSPLHAAVLHGHVDHVIRYIASAPLLVHAVDRHGNTPLHHACVIGQHEIARLLVEGGGDVDARNATGHTPLHKAALGGHMACVALLIESHANVLRKNEKGQYASDLAGWRMHTDVTKYLRDLDLKAILQILPDEQGNTRLHYAAACNKLNAVISILQDRMQNDVDVRNKAGETPLHAAAREGHYDIIEALVARGANPCAVTLSGECAVTLAGGHHIRVRNGLLRLERTYLTDQFDQEENGNSALHVACALGRVSLVKELLDSNDDLDCINHDGNTPLHVAVAHDRVDVVTFLLANAPMIDVTVRNNVGQSAADLGSSSPSLRWSLLRAEAEVVARYCVDSVVESWDRQML
ncbi:hypothetical protein H257_13153 [Aphanomyces astaci]|uniref:Uncharacterized protein n=1 Tax=Aphanomyces astaci TaxID=112090 RepID=W4FXP4_APHAT|nr:hypothetical protein H257_13153 [Aphanomyces astaci]ETV71726.1 hypothetical protein H257_13153 [Aphanomyces astaci]|eukprot:XP_009838914.1 hypothetical protein H257_13153 [Aphanomyces astaci]